MCASSSRREYCQVECASERFLVECVPFGSGGKGALPHCTHTGMHIHPNAHGDGDVETLHWARLKLSQAFSSPSDLEMNDNANKSQLPSRRFMNSVIKRRRDRSDINIYTTTTFIKFTRNRAFNLFLASLYSAFQCKWLGTHCWWSLSTLYTSTRKPESVQVPWHSDAPVTHPCVQPTTSHWMSANPMSWLWILWASSSSATHITENLTWTTHGHLGREGEESPLPPSDSLRQSLGVPKTFFSLVLWKAS